jgi:hypothetical protein
MHVTMIRMFGRMFIIKTLLFILGGLRNILVLPIS